MLSAITCSRRVALVRLGRGFVANVARILAMLSSSCNGCTSFHHMQPSNK